MSELKPCPFCGGGVQVRKRVFGPTDTGYIKFQIKCCVVNVVRSTEFAAIAAWNRRATPARAEGEVGISAQDPLVILAGIKQFGLAPDGSDLRDLEAALLRAKDNADG